MMAPLWIITFSPLLEPLMGRHYLEILGIQYPIKQTNPIKMRTSSKLVSLVEPIQFATATLFYPISMYY